MTAESPPTTTHHIGAQPQSSFKGTLILLVAAVIGIGILQKVGGKTKVQRTPGPTRGDVVLTEDALPQSLGNWTRKTFTPAPPVEELPKGQFWWVHQWLYQANGAQAIVSFDQLGEDQWHELTYCYRVQGQTIETREVLEPQDGTGPFAVAKLRSPEGNLSILVFSAFFEDGSWASPPQVNLSLLNNKTRNETVGWRLQNRVNPVLTYESWESGHTRALQCQVLVHGDQEKLDSLIASAIQLHLETRMAFRQHWLTHTETLQPTTD